MPTYLSPGVYIEEVQSGSRPIEGVGTAVAAFVGLSEVGPLHNPTLVSNWSQYAAAFGDFVEGAYLAHAVYAYFQNGGGNCYVVRVGGPTGANGSSPNGASSTTPAVGGPNPAALPAAPAGVLGDGGYRVVVRDDAPTGQVSVEVQDAGGDNPTPEMFKLVVSLDGDRKSVV